MKVKEFVEKYKKSNGLQTMKSLVAAKTYLPYTEKQNLVESILDKSMDINNGFVQFDETKKYIIFTLDVVSTYTDIEFDEDFNVAIAEYDMLCEAGALNSIIETFEGEYQTVLNMLKMRQGYILQSNSIEAQIAKFLSGLNDKLEVVMESISGNFNAFQNLNVSAADIDKLTKLIGTLGK